MKFLPKFFLSLCVMAMSAVGVGQASAMTVITDWDYSVTTTFTAWTWTVNGAVDPVAGTDSGAAGTYGSASVLSWGGNGDYSPLGGNRSALTLDLTNPETGSVMTGGPVSDPTSSLTHWNNIISLNFDPLGTAVISTTLSLDPTNPDLAGFDLPDLVFDINFAETPNDGGGDATCSIGVPHCPDIFVLTGQTSLEQQFTIDQITYEVSIIPLSAALIGLPLAACLEAGAAFPCVGFTTEENAATTLTFGFLITQVPEPGTLSLLGLGLVGGAVLRRRKTA